jgi:predicted unusual protein kinase regulating ubiquinone biosynthesis (AarF/ABC1/UbiB family)
MGEMKGAVMKIGQLLSFVDSQLVPPAYRAALATLQSDAPPMSSGTTAAVIETELGAPPDEIFASFSPEPIAAASIGQVHRAQLRDDPTPLAVKVQYPGVAEAIRTDLANGALISMAVSALQSILGDTIPQIDAQAVIAEVKERIGEEVDYRTEMANQQEFADLFRGDPTIRISEVVPELSTGKVLTMELAGGARWGEATAAPRTDRDRWGETIARFVFGSFHDHGLFNADPHPGNYLFGDDGVVTFLDFGCVKRFGRDRVDAVEGVARAVMTGDRDQIVDAMAASGIVRETPSLDRDEVASLARRMYEPILAPQPFTYSRRWAAATVGDVLNPRLGQQGAAGRLELPRDHVFLLRITAGLNSVLAGLRATIDWDRLGRELWPPDGLGPPRRRRA